MIRRLFTENLGWKAASLLIATAMWFALAGEPELYTSISVPVQYVSMPRDLEISSDVAERVRLDIRGTSGKLSAESLHEAAVVVNLSSVAKPGERTFPIEAANANLPIGVSIVRTVPSQVRLNFERRLSRQVPVTVRIGTPPPADYEVVKQTADPAEVRIAGPESHVQAVDDVESDALDLSGTVGRTEFSTPVFVPDSHVRLETAQRVKVTVEVRKKGQTGK